jgi:NAD(P)-dependent dehydrogenase (short-subunit alcohol dehydrogenase family)
MLPFNELPVAEPTADALKDQVILITGAGDGFGKATALQAATLGATCVLLGKTVKKLEATFDAIVAAGGAEPAIYPINLTGANWGDLAEVALTIDKTFGRLDVLCLAAAHFKTFTRMEDVEPKDWLETLQVNLTASFALTRHCLPLLQAAPRGQVVFVGDAGGRKAKPFQGAYGISKVAVETMAAQWALEAGADSRLRFHSFDPGPMRTGIRLKGYPGEVLEQTPPPSLAASALMRVLTSDAPSSAWSTRAT